MGIFYFRFCIADLRFSIPGGGSERISGHLSGGSLFFMTFAIFVVDLVALTCGKKLPNMVL